MLTIDIGYEAGVPPATAEGSGSVARMLWLSDQGCCPRKLAEKGPN